TVQARMVTTCCACTSAPMPTTSVNTTTAANQTLKRLIPATAYPPPKLPTRVLNKPRARACGRAPHSRPLQATDGSVPGLGRSLVPPPPFQTTPRPVVEFRYLLGSASTRTLNSTLRANILLGRAEPLRSLFLQCLDCHQRG